MRAAHKLLMCALSTGLYLLECHCALRLRDPRFCPISNATQLLGQSCRIWANFVCGLGQQHTRVICDPLCFIKRLIIMWTGSWGEKVTPLCNHYGNDHVIFIYNSDEIVLFTMMQSLNRWTFLCKSLPIVSDEWSLHRLRSEIKHRLLYLLKIAESVAK